VGAYWCIWQRLQRDSEGQLSVPAGDPGLSGRVSLTTCSTDWLFQINWLEQTVHGCNVESTLCVWEGKRKRQRSA